LRWRPESSFRQPVRSRDILGKVDLSRGHAPLSGLFFAASMHYVMMARSAWPRPKSGIPAGDSNMAMTMTGEYQLGATRDVVWAKLNDPEILKSCIPGCEELEKISDTEFRATAKMKVGPVSARFKGKVNLSDLDPPNGYKITGEGEGGVAGFAKGGATVALGEANGGTVLTYNVEAQIGGKLAQLGQRLINGAAKKLADEFFANFAEAVQGKQP
jgi:hypothetical protein